MRELQHNLDGSFPDSHCTKPRLMRELQPKEKHRTPMSELYQTKTHEGTTTLPHVS